MSNPKQLTTELTQIRDSLLKFGSSGVVRYYFSSTIVAEMLPVSVDYHDSASARFDILAKFCGRNSLIWHEQLLKNEISRMLGMEVPEEPYAESGGWLPLAALGGNLNLFEDADRETRRKVKRAFRKSLERGEIPEELKEFPFPDSVKLAVARSAAGDGDGAGIMDAIADSFQDPRQFLAYLLTEPDQCRSFSNIVRGSAQSVMESVLTTMAAAAEVRKNAAASDIEVEKISREDWLEVSERAIVNIFKDLFVYFYKKPLGTDVELEEIRNNCPGLFAMLNSAYEVWWKSMVETPRRPQASDFGDALHATYAPYVDIFRADQGMSGSVTSSVKSRVIVVRRLKELPSAIEEELRRRNISHSLVGWGEQRNPQNSGSGLNV